MILDMAEFGLKAWPPTTPQLAPNASPWFERATREGAESIQLATGVYRCDSPVEINYGILGMSGAGIVRNFPTDTDTEAMFTVRNLFSAQFRNFGVASSANCQRNGVGTGCLITGMPRAGEQFTSSKWESVNFTSAAAAGPWPHQAYHKHNLYLDGTVGGTAYTTHIRTMDIHDCTFFGTESEANGGSSLFLKGTSSVRLTGGGITYSGGRAAILRIDGGPQTRPDGTPGYAQTGNCFINPNGCMKIILANCNEIQLMCPVVEGDVVRGPNANGIWGVGRLKNNGKLVGDWNNFTKVHPLGTGAVWQEY